MAFWVARLGALILLAAGFLTAPRSFQRIQEVAQAVSSTHSSERQAPGDRRYLVLIVVDGARPDYLDVPGVPHISALMRNGTRYTNAWAGILESETPSGHAAIATGSEPRKNSIIAFGWANARNESVNLWDPGVVPDEMMERHLRLAHAPTIASLVHGRDPHARVVALSGYKYYAADAIGGPDADVIMYYTTRKNGSFVPTSVPGHVAPASVLSAPGLAAPTKNLPFGQGNHLAMKLAAATFRRMHQQVTLINLPESDWPLGHNWGADRDRKDVVRVMQGVDRDLGMLEDTYRKAGVLDRTDFVLTADHGFAPIYHQVPKPVVASAVTAAGTSIIRDTYHTGAYLWLKDESRAPRAAAILAARHNRYIQSIYVRQETRHGPRYIRASSANLFRTRGMEAAHQYLLHTFNGPNGPDLAVFFREDAAAIAQGQSGWKGDHGGADWDSQHLPMVISGPGVRRGHVSSYPARLIDIAPTVLTLLGAPHTGMQGDVLADALISPTKGAKRIQARRESILQPVISALKREAEAESTGDRRTE